MKSFGCLAVLALLVAAQPARADFKVSQLRFMGTLAQDPKAWLFFGGMTLEIGWMIEPGTGKEKMNIDLLRANGSPVYRIAAGLTNKFANMGPGGHSYWYNGYPWKLGLDDVDCFYKVRISIEGSPTAITSGPFNIYPALQFVKNDVRSYARLDTPEGGKNYILGRNLDITWTAMSKRSAWPSQKIELKLMANDNGNIVPVGEIAHVGIDMTACNIHGKYTWKVGSLLTVVNQGKKPDGKNGIKYRVRLTGDTSTYDSDDFTIGNLTMQGQPLHPGVPKGNER